MTGCGAVALRAHRLLSQCVFQRHPEFSVRRQVMDGIFYKRGNIRGKVAVIKALASALSIGSSAAVGREGPIIQIGAALGSAFAQAIKLSICQKTTLLSADAGAGIAATFNTPSAWPQLV
jgi:H+/Cl- antiporter ClcA